MRSSFLYNTRSPPPHPLSIQLFKTSRRLSSLFWFLSPRGAQAQLTLPTPTNSREESCSFQLSSPRKPPCNSSSTTLSRDVTSFRRTSSPQRSCKAQQNHEGHISGKDDFTELRTAQQTLLPLFMDGNITGLITYKHTRLSKTVHRFYVMFINVICDVVIFWL